MKKKLIIGGIIISLLIVGLFVYLNSINWLIIQCDEIYPLNGEEVYILDKNQTVMIEKEVAQEGGVVFYLHPLNPTVLYNPTTSETKPNAPSNAVAGNGMIIGSTAVYNLEQFWGKKIKVTGTRYMGNPMLLKDVTLLNDNWKNIPVIAIEKIELAE